MHWVGLFWCLCHISKLQCCNCLTVWYSFSTAFMREIDCVVYLYWGFFFPFQRINMRKLSGTLTETNPRWMQNESHLHIILNWHPHISLSSFFKVRTLLNCLRIFNCRGIISLYEFLLKNFYVNLFILILLNCVYFRFYTVETQYEEFAMGQWNRSSDAVCFLICLNSIQLS